MKYFDALTNKLVKCYFRGSLDFTLQPNEIQKMTLQWQNQFLDITVNNSFIKQYPLSPEFSKFFFKMIIAYLHNREIHDDMYSTLCQAMGSRCDNTFCYRHYIIGNNLADVITIKETNKLVVDGTTGMRTWEAAVILADWAMYNSDKIKGKKVLELGSGIGFTGVAIAKHCAPKEMLLTDCHPGVLMTICDNIKINFPHIHEEEEETMYRLNNRKIGAMTLDWNAIENIPSDIVPDIIIGADIVYDPETIKSLSEVLRAFFDRNPKMMVYIASIIRNEDTFEEFKVFLRSLKIKYHTVPYDKSVFVDWKHTMTKVLLKINL